MAEELYIKAMAAGDEDARYFLGSKLRSHQPVKLIHPDTMPSSIASHQ
jgi:hypothetical protein